MKVIVVHEPLDIERRWAHDVAWAVNLLPGECRVVYGKTEDDGQIDKIARLVAILGAEGQQVTDLDEPATFERLAASRPHATVIVVASPPATAAFHALVRKHVDLRSRAEALVTLVPNCIQMLHLPISANDMATYSVIYY